MLQLALNDRNKTYFVKFCRQTSYLPPKYTFGPKFQHFDSDPLFDPLDPQNFFDPKLLILTQFDPQTTYLAQLCPQTPYLPPDQHLKKI